MLICVLFLSLIANVLSCASCYSNGFQFSCGITANMGGCTYKCCNGIWRACPQCDPYPCPVCPMIDHPVIEYKNTSQGILYSNQIQTAIKENNIYVKGPIVHSSKLNVGSHVWWPIESEKMAVLEVEHHNVTEYKDNCCWSIEVGTSCVYKYCCGTGCCC